MIGHFFVKVNGHEGKKGGEEVEQLGAEMNMLNLTPKRNLLPGVENF